MGSQHVLKLRALRVRGLRLFRGGGADTGLWV